MGISVKTKKNLWAKSGNRCAICRTELFVETELENKFNIGEECHIISSKTNGPRHKENLEDYDTFDNLILLCRNHHKEIDELDEVYTEELLRHMKLNHESWVNDTLNKELDSKKNEELRFLKRVTSGKELANIIFDIDGYRLDYDNINTDAEADYIGEVLQTLSDYCDISTNFEIDDKVKVSLELNKILKELEKNGYFLFGEKKFETYKGCKNFSIVTIVIKKENDDEIIKVKSR